MRDVAARADVLVSDAGLPARGIQAARVCAVLSMDGTPAGDIAQSEFTIEARAGLLDVVGDPDRSPLRLGGHQTAYAAGLAAFTGMMAALCQPALPEGPRHVRVSLLETAIWLNWKGLAVVQRTGKAPRRAGGLGEWPVLPCADGHVVAVHRVQEWARLQALVDDPVLREERFQTVAGRRAHRADLNAVLARFFAPMTRAEIHAMALLQKFPFGPVWTPEELRADAQMLARGVFAGPLPRVPVIWREGVA
jgi:crotonobetainyl-CoA:carnitine CoA-transferase CaiB-like acyl-CoA transferase